ncbi:MAG: TatD family hydrolase [Streptosporangiaceae bacterium]
MTVFPPAPEPLPAGALDSHCHLEMLESPVERVVEAARSVGIRRVVTIGTDLPTSYWAAEQASMYDDVWGAVAIHPNEARHATGDTLDEIAKLAQRPGVRAVGETGLDYYRDWADPEVQRRSFRAHIAIAKRAGKALVIHDREAHDDVLRILTEEGAPERVVFHCFSGDAEMARACASAGYVMSFAGNVTFDSAENLREAARVVPLDRLLVETDAPFLTPVPYRGKPNAPYLVPYTIRALAEIKGVDLEELCVAVTATADNVFRPR